MHFYIINITEIRISINKVLINTQDCSVIENDSQLITKIGENRCIFVFVFGKNYIFTFIKKLSGS